MTKVTKSKKIETKTKVAPKSKLIWIETKKGEQWVTSEIPSGECCTPRITKSSKNNDGSYSYFCYRDSRALGVKKTLEEAKKCCERNEPTKSDQDNVLNYAKNHPGEIPPFLQLTSEERLAVRKCYPLLAPAAKIVARAEKRGVGGDAGNDADPGTRKLREEMALRNAEKSAQSNGKVKREKKDAPEFDMSGVMERVRDGNPKKVGSGAYKRWALMFEHAEKGSTVAEYEKAKGNLETLANAVRMKWVMVRSTK